MLRTKGRCAGGAAPSIDLVDCATNDAVFFCLCSVSYFLDAPSRLANDCYFSRLLDIVRRPEGMPLLKALSQAEAQLAAVFKSPHAVAGEYCVIPAAFTGTHCAPWGCAPGGALLTLYTACIPLLGVQMQMQM